MAVDKVILLFEIIESTLKLLCSLQIGEPADFLVGYIHGTEDKKSRRRH